MMFKLAEDRRKIMETMRRNEGLEKMLNETPRTLCLNLPCQMGSGTGSPFCGVSYQSQEFSSSPSSLFANNGLCLSDDASQFSAMGGPFNLSDCNQCRPTADDANGLWLGSNKTIDSVPHLRSERRLENDEQLPGLCDNFFRMMTIREEQQKDGGIIKKNRPEMDPHRICFGYGDCSLDGSAPYNIKNYGTYGSSEVYNNSSAFPYHGFGSSGSSSTSPPMNFDSEMNSACNGFLGGYDKSDFNSADSAQIHSNDLSSASSYYHTQSSYLFHQRKENGQGCTNGEFQFQNPSRVRPYLCDALVSSQQYGIGSDGIMDQLSSTQLIHSNLNLGLNSLSNNRVSQSEMPVKGVGSVDNVGLEDSFIIQGRSVDYITNKGCNLSRGHKKNNHDEAPTLGNCACDHGGGPFKNGHSLSSPSQASSCILAEVRGYVHLMAKDQNGCRFLQRVFDEGTDLDVKIIFNEIIDQVVELMMEQFGNYLVQKLLDVCSEEQRTHIVLMVTQEPGQLVQISLNTYGTRVVQKLIETLKTRQQISLVTAALRPGFLDLVKDLNGNHVLQRCLQCFTNKDNEFIFDTAAKFCIEIATHRHGCCVLQRCITHSKDKYHDKLIAEVSRNGLLLAQDPFGNYVVQYIIELKIPSAAANLLAQFKGHYVHLSMQKCSSHVVEKCLKNFAESRTQIVYELLSVPNFEQLLQDPFANYVIQTALSVTKGILHTSLVDAVRPHSILRTSPYCKRIFSRNISKK